jgi:uncharacterized membrane protein YesL
METIKPILPSPWQLLKSAWQLYKQRFLPLLVLTIYSVFGILFVYLVTYISKRIPDLGPESIYKTILVVFMILVIIAAWFFGIYLSIRAKCGLYLLCSFPNKTSANNTFKQTKGLTWKFFSSSFLMAIFTLLWMILLIIPGLIFGIYYGFAPMIAIFENKKALASIKASKQLVKNYWWPVFGRLLFIMVIAFVLGLISSVITGLFPKNSAPAITFNIIYEIIVIVLSPIAVAYSYLIYKNLFAIKNNL